jgi:hypothetical protein
MLKPKERTGANRSASAARLFPLVREDTCVDWRDEHLSQSDLPPAVWSTILPSEAREACTNGEVPTYSTSSSQP